MPVAAGRMRNDWYPRRKADYMTDAQLRTSNMRDTPAERDFNFRPDQRRGMVPLEEGSDNGSVVDMQSQLLAVRFFCCSFRRLDCLLISIQAPACNRIDINSSSANYWLLPRSNLQSFG